MAPTLLLTLVLFPLSDSWGGILMGPSKDKPASEQQGWVDLTGVFVKVPFQSGKPAFENAGYTWKQGNDLFALNKDDKGAPRFMVTCAPFEHSRFEGTLRESHEWQIFTKDKWALHLQASKSTLVAKQEADQSKQLEDAARSVVASHRSSKEAFQIVDFKWQKSEQDRRVSFTATCAIDARAHVFHFWQTDLDASTATSTTKPRLIVVTYSDQVAKGAPTSPPSCFTGMVASLKAHWLAK